MQLTDHQLKLIERPPSGMVFLEGPAGAGKTTVGVERLLHLMSQGVRADSILLFLPQRNLAMPYYQALHNPGLVAGGVQKAVGHLSLVSRGMNRLDGRLQMGHRLALGFAGGFFCRLDLQWQFADEPAELGAEAVHVAVDDFLETIVQFFFDVGSLHGDPPVAR